MHYYGQPITYGPLSAPQLFTGDIVNFSYRDSETDEDLTDGADDIAALAFHSRQAEIEFESEITKNSKNFVNLSTGAKFAVSNLSTGTVLASEAVERWVLGQRKRASIRATHFPDLVHSGSDGLATATLDAFTPDQSGLNIVYPGDELIYGTYGLTHEAGVVHELTLTQRWQLRPNPPSPDGKILGAAVSRYKCTISLLLLALDDIPAIRSELVITGAPGHATKFLITAAEERFERMNGKMYAVSASWIPPFGSGGSEGGGGEGGGGGTE